MKRLLSVFTIFFFSIFSVISSYASLRTPSNAQIMPMSSLGTVTNTIDLSDVRFYVYYYDSGTGVDDVLQFGSGSVSNGRFRYSISLSEGDIVHYFGFQLPSSSLPSPGTYQFAFDLASNVSYSVNGVALFSVKNNNNAGQQTDDLSLTYKSSSGDIYVPNYLLNLTNLNRLNVEIHIPDSDSIYVLSGSCAFRFLVADSDPDAPSTAGSDTSSQDWENSVSSGLSDISSGLGSIDAGISDMGSDLSNISDELNYISESQNLIIEGIDNVILHISDQLYAFWDQLYNLIHVPTYAILQQILQAINDLDINIEVDLGEIKTAIQNQTSSLLSQLTDSTVQIGSDIDDATDQVVNGYDPSGIESDNERLDQVINEYDDVESELFDDSKDYISGFDFEDGLDQYLGPLQDISGFLGGIYTTLAGLNIPIGFSLTLTIALLFIGYYRFKGGG